MGARSRRLPDTTSEVRDDLKSSAHQPIALRIPDAARLVGLSRSTLYEEMDRGALAYVKVGARRLVLREDLVEFLRRRRVVAGK